MTKVWQSIAGVLAAGAALVAILGFLGVDADPAPTPSPTPAVHETPQRAPDSTPVSAPTADPGDNAAERRRWAQAVDDLCAEHRVRVGQLGTPLPEQEALFRRTLGDMFYALADQARSLGAPAGMADDADEAFAAWDEAGDASYDAAAAWDAGNLPRHQIAIQRATEHVRRATVTLRTLDVRVCAN